MTVEAIGRRINHFLEAKNEQKNYIFFASSIRNDQFSVFFYRNISLVHKSDYVRYAHDDDQSLSIYVLSFTQIMYTLSLNETRSTLFVFHLDFFS